MKFRLVVLVGLMACGGVDPEEFNERYGEDLCSLLFDCQEESGGFVFGDDVEQCQSLVALAYSAAGDTCEFDQDAAEACLDALGEATCDTLYTSAALSCASVYTGESCSVTSGTTN